MTRNIVAIIFLSMLLASCRPVEENFTVSLALSGSPSTLDPHATTETLTFQVLRSIYDTLLEPDQHGNLVPSLAQSWEISPDNLSITLNLRKDIQFHDGSQFDSADVEASIGRILSPEFASPSVSEFAVISRILRLDDFTIRLDLSEPNATILYTLASGWSAILPSEAIEAGHSFAKLPIGTGPFRFSQWTADESIELLRNENYWMPNIEVERIVFQIITERSVQVQALLADQVDILYIVNEEDIPILEAARDINIEEIDTSLILVIAINTSRDILSELPMRQAINHSIDKQKVIDIAYGGGTVGGTFNDPSSAFFVDYSHLYEYNPQIAQQLLADIGYSPDRVFDLVIPQNFTNHVRAGELYQEMLRETGIQTQIRLVDWPTWISDVYGNANFDLTVIGHTGKLDPDGRFLNYGTNATYVRWENEEIASLINEGRRTVDLSARRAIYNRVQEIFARELPFVFVGTSVRRIAYTSKIEGFVMTPNLDTFDFRSIRRSTSN